MVSASPAVALVGSFELLMMLTRSAVSAASSGTAVEVRRSESEQTGSACTTLEQAPEEAVLTDYLASLEGPGRPLSQRFLASKHGIDRRKVKQIISAVAQPART